MSPPRTDPVSNHIFTIRGQRVLLDTDLALLYGTTTKAFNQSIKRNAARFPADFAFQLSVAEFKRLRSRVASSAGPMGETAPLNWSQFVTSSKASRRGAFYRPWAFTEHGAVMAANVLRSAQAVEMSVYVVRAFILQREMLATNGTILRRLAEIDKSLLQHDAALRALWQKLQPLLASPPRLPAREMGFHVGMRKP